MIRRDPDMIDIADIAALGLDEAHAAWSETCDGPNPLMEAEEPVVRGYLADIPPGRALDVGCGTGRLTRVLAELGHDVAAIDRSSQMLSAANAKGIRATFIHGDTKRIPLANATVDLAASSLALTHIEDLRGPLSEIARVRETGWLSRPVGYPSTRGGDRSSRLLRDVGWVERRDSERIALDECIPAGFDSADCEVKSCAEPLYEPRFADEVSDDEPRAAVLAALPGLPFALVWLLRRR